jgi:hypothetical protein
MVLPDQKATDTRRAAVFFGTVLCVLLAFFAVERKVAAYPPHSIAAATIVATGVQKPEPIAFTERQSLEAPVLFVCALFLLATFAEHSPLYLAERGIEAGFFSWAPTPLAVRPPPAL